MANRIEPGQDIRTHPGDPEMIWRDGTCLDCGAPTGGTSSVLTPASAGIDRYTQATTDYYIWCRNPQCHNYGGECVGEMACPPPWATHDQP